ncbi:LLM class flavin-dependent oxidoreductase [Paraburkholderia fungorum]
MRGQRDDCRFLSWHRYPQVQTVVALGSQASCPQQSEKILTACGIALPRGRRFAARWAETVIGTARSVAAMKAFRDDIRAKAREAGRDPDSIKVATTRWLFRRHARPGSA